MERLNVANAVAPEAAQTGAIRDFVSLTKPRIISLLLVTTIAPMYVAGTPTLWQEASRGSVGWLSVKSAHLTTCPSDGWLTLGAGNYAAWTHRFYKYRGFPTLLGPTSGAMGYGLSAAVAAKIVHPEKTVVCAAGDGCFRL